MAAQQDVIAGGVDFVQPSLGIQPRCRVWDKFLNRPFPVEGVEQGIGAVGEGEGSWRRPWRRCPWRPCGDRHPAKSAAKPGPAHSGTAPGGGVWGVLSFFSDSSSLDSGFWYMGMLGKSDQSLGLGSGRVRVGRPSLRGLSCGCNRRMRRPGFRRHSCPRPRWRRRGQRAMERLPAISSGELHQWHNPLSLLKIRSALAGLSLRRKRRSRSSFGTVPRRISGLPPRAPLTLPLAVSRAALLWSRTMRRE